MIEEQNSNKDILEHQNKLGEIGLEVLKLLVKEKLTFTEVLMILETTKYKFISEQIKKDMMKSLINEVFR